MKKRKCVITGIGIVSCFGSDKDNFYQNLLEGNSGVDFIDLEVPGIENIFGAKVRDFSAEEFLDKKNARRVDPAIAYAMGGSALAIKDGNLDVNAISPTKAGVLIGTGIGGMQTTYKNLATALSKNFSKVSPFFIPHMLTNMPGAMVGIKYGFKGPNYSISTACATANYSLCSAKKYIEQGDCDVMLSGGVEASINIPSFGGFAALHALSKNKHAPQQASKPFDKHRDGFVMGEGAGVFLLESEEHAIKRGAKIYATLSGGAVNSDAYHMTNPISDGSQVANCIEMALKNANISSDKIDYINAHATSTPTGDLCEIRAIDKVFGKNKSFPYINSTKSMLGHALGAAGGLELAAVLMAMKTKKLHPTINVTEKEEELEKFNILDKGSVECDISHAISNSFGFGGHNSVLVVSAYK